MKSNVNNCKKSKCNGCLACTTKKLKKSVFAQPKRDEIILTAEEQHRRLLDRIIQNYSGEEILRELSKFGMPALLIIASIGHDVGISKLILTGTDVNVTHPQEGSTALHLAAKGSHICLMKLLLDAKADPSIANEEGNNPFMVAVNTGNVQAVNLLWLQRAKFDINHANKIGYTAMHIAAERTWESCIYILICGGAARNWTANDGSTAMIIAARKGDLKTVEHLVESGADILVEDNGNCTAICVAIKECKRVTYDYLMRKLLDRDREDYVKRRIDLLSILPNTEETDEFYDDTLYHVLRVLAQHPACRELVYSHCLVAKWIHAIARHLENESVTDKALHYLTEVLCVQPRCFVTDDEQEPPASDSDASVVEPRFVEQFIRCDGPELMLRALVYYKDTNSHDMICSCLLPMLTLSEISEGRSWIERFYYKLAEYLPIFEADQDSLDYPDSTMRNIVASLWGTFHESFAFIQAQQAELHGAELVATEEREKARRERKREKRRQKRLLQRTKDAQMAAQVATATAAATGDATTTTSTKDAATSLCSASGASGASELCAQALASSINKLLPNPKPLRYSEMSNNLTPRPVALADNVGADGSTDGDTDIVERTTIKAKRTKNKLMQPDFQSAKVTSITSVSRRCNHKADSGIESAFEEVLPKRKVKQLKRERQQNDSPHKTPAAAQQIKQENESSVADHNGDHYTRLDAQTAAAVGDDSRRNSSNSQNRASTPEYWDVDEFHARGAYHTEDSSVDSEIMHHIAGDDAGEEEDVSNVSKRHRCRSRCKNKLDVKEEHLSQSNHKPLNEVGKKTRKERVVISVKNPAVTESNPCHIKASRSTVKECPLATSTWADMLKGALSDLSISSEDQQYMSNMSALETHKRIFSGQTTSECSNAQSNQVKTATSTKERRVNARHVKTLLDTKPMTSNKDDQNADIYESSGARKPKNRRLLRGMTVPLQTFLKLERGLAMGEGSTYKEKPADKTTKVEIKSQNNESHMQQGLYDNETTCIGMSPLANIDFNTTLASTDNYNYDNSDLVYEEYNESKMANEDRLFEPIRSASEELCHASSGSLPMDVEADVSRVLTPPPTHNAHKVEKVDVAESDGSSELIDLRHFVAPEETDVEFARLTPDPDVLYDDRETSAYFMGVRRDWFGDGRRFFVPHDTWTTLMQAQIGQVRRDGVEIYGYDHGPRRRSDVYGKHRRGTSSTTQNDSAVDNCVTPPHFWLPSCIKADLGETENAGNRTARLDNDDDDDEDDEELLAIAAAYVRRENLWRAQMSARARNTAERIQLASVSSTKEKTQATLDTLENFAAIASQCKNARRPQEQAAGYKRFVPVCGSARQHSSPVSASSSIMSPLTVLRGSRWREKAEQLQLLPGVMKGHFGRITLAKKYTDFTLDYSGRGNLLLMGLLDQRHVAVKRYQRRHFEHIKSDLHHLVRAQLKHKNILAYSHIETDDVFGYVAMELCECNLDNFIRQMRRTGSVNQKLATNVAREMLQGIRYLHCHDMVHGRLKPQNVLVDINGRIRLSDFGLPEIESPTNHWSGEGLASHYCWRSSESTAFLRHKYSDVTLGFKADVQVAGMLLYYILTGGEHPYGESAISIEQNIARGWPKMRKLTPQCDDLIRSILLFAPPNRPSIDDVLRHPFFNDESKKTNSATRDTGTRIERD